MYFCHFNSKDRVICGIKEPFENFCRWHCNPSNNDIIFCPYKHVFVFTCRSDRVQRKSVLQTAIPASCSEHVLAPKSFQLASKPFLISRIDYHPSVI